MTHRIIALLVTLAFTLLVASLAAEAQQATNVHRVGRLLAAGILYAALDKTFFFALSEPVWGSPMTETAWNV
jgi:hypothetical protein